MWLKVEDGTRLINLDKVVEINSKFNHYKAAGFEYEVYANFYAERINNLPMIEDFYLASFGSQYEADAFINEIYKAIKEDYKAVDIRRLKVIVRENGAAKAELWEEYYEE